MSGANHGSVGLNTLMDDLLTGKETLAVVGLGYVGLPIALAFAGKMNVIGYDINQKKVDIMQSGKDPNNELEDDAFVGKSIRFTTTIEDLSEARVFVVAVPTPVTRFNVPNLGPLESASGDVAKVLSKGDVVIYESTVYPGCTEEDCVPILDAASGLRFPNDYKVAYSPERINPGDKVHTLTNTIKIVSGCDEETLDFVASLYESIIEAGVFRASSIKVAEAAKIVENTQRDLNIALMNELSMIFDRLDINTLDVIEAAGTKWNFQKFTPGLVGGHCIGVDPYYLTHKSIELGYRPEIILSGRKVNDNLSKYVAKKTIQKIASKGKNINEAKVLVLGVTFKENVSDIRNSKVVDMIKDLRSYSLQVDIHDPHANQSELEEEYQLTLTPEIGSHYDGIILAVMHKEYLHFDEAYFKSISSSDPVFMDIKSAYLGQMKDMDYWAL